MKCGNCPIKENGCTDKCQMYELEQDQPYTKPPLGLEPHTIWVGKRMQDIKEAIDRYKENNKCIPVEWINEYNELLTNLNAVRGE